MKESQKKTINTFIECLLGEECFPPVAIIAFDAVFDDGLYRHWKGEFEKCKIKDCIKQLRKIIKHPCPQNRISSLNPDDPGIQQLPYCEYAVVRGNLTAYSLDPNGKPVFALRNGSVITGDCIINNFYSPGDEDIGKKNEDDIKIVFTAKEEYGLLGLTKDGPITKEEVVNYIKELIKTEKENLLIEHKSQIEEVETIVNVLHNGLLLNIHSPEEVSNIKRALSVLESKSEENIPRLRAVVLSLSFKQYQFYPRLGQMFEAYVLNAANHICSEVTHVLKTYQSKQSSNETSNNNNSDSNIEIVTKQKELQARFLVRQKTQCWLSAVRKNDVAQMKLWHELIVCPDFDEHVEDCCGKSAIYYALKKNNIALVYELFIVYKVDLFAPSLQKLEGPIVQAIKAAEKSLVEDQRKSLQEKLESLLENKIERHDLPYFIENKHSITTTDDLRALYSFSVVTLVFDRTFKKYLEKLKLDLDSYFFHPFVDVVNFFKSDTYKSTRDVFRLLNKLDEFDAHINFMILRLSKDFKLFLANPSPQINNHVNWPGWYKSRFTALKLKKEYDEIVKENYKRREEYFSALLKEVPVPYDKFKQLKDQYRRTDEENYFIVLFNTHIRPVQLEINILALSDYLEGRVLYQKSPLKELHANFVALDASEKFDGIVYVFFGKLSRILTTRPLVLQPNTALHLRRYRECESLGSYYQNVSELESNLTACLKELDETLFITLNTQLIKGKRFNLNSPFIRELTTQYRLLGFEYRCAQVIKKYEVHLQRQLQKEKSAPFEFYRLPPDIKKQILSYLPIPQIVTVVSRVNKEWSQIVKKDVFWMAVSENQPPQPDSQLLQDLFKSKDHTTTLVDFLNGLLTAGSFIFEKDEWVTIVSRISDESLLYSQTEKYSFLKRYFNVKDLRNIFCQLSRHAEQVSKQQNDASLQKHPWLSFFAKQFEARLVNLYSFHEVINKNLNGFNYRVFFDDYAYKANVAFLMKLAMMCYREYETPPIKQIDTYHLNLNGAEEVRMLSNLLLSDHGLIISRKHAGMLSAFILHLSEGCYHDPVWHEEFYDNSGFSGFSRCTVITEQTSKIFRFVIHLRRDYHGLENFVGCCFSDAKELFSDVPKLAEIFLMLSDQARRRNIVAKRILDDVLFNPFLFSTKNNTSMLKFILQEHDFQFFIRSALVVLISRYSPEFALKVAELPNLPQLISRESLIRFIIDRIEHPIIFNVLSHKDIQAALSADDLVRLILLNKKIHGDKGLEIEEYIFQSSDLYKKLEPIHYQQLLYYFSYTDSRDRCRKNLIRASQIKSMLEMEATKKGNSAQSKEIEMNEKKTIAKLFLVSVFFSGCAVGAFLIPPFLPLALLLSAIALTFAIVGVISLIVLKYGDEHRMGKYLDAHPIPYVPSIQGENSLPEYAPTNSFDMPPPMQPLGYYKPITSIGLQLLKQQPVSSYETMRLSSSVAQEMSTIPLFPPSPKT